MDLKSFSKYTRPDREKRALIDSALPKVELKKFMMKGLDVAEECLCEIAYEEKPAKICPKCGKKYPADENFCFACGVALNDLRHADIKTLDVKHEFSFDGSAVLSDFEEIFTTENLILINDFDFTRRDFNKILKDIRITALKSIDDAIKQNAVDLDSLSCLEKVLLFTKAFVDVKYKSYGQELGYYSFNTIIVDDRQLDALQITTMLHELTHFLIKEMLVHIMCRLLDASKTREMESIITFILTYSKENCLIDEYAAHTVEGRFTLFGYQDYSSFLNIQKEIDLPEDEIEMLKTIGNTLAHMIKTIIESFITDQMLSDIKTQFRSDILDRPDYTQLRHENCILLTYEGFFQVIQCILVEGFAFASENVEKLKEINEMW
ncbi:MAG: zinc ribbon domain-containing protein [Methanobrevibacter sp.]|nr:zinc ribbon domain-containing protein [Methanobrevibacter sp.]MBQ6630283.1 zinc ribbon domain-containing protein [Methanobrevibacter sp.]